MDEKTLGFVSLLERALDIIEQRINLRNRGVQDSAPPGALEYIAKGLSKERDEALGGQTPPSRGIVTLGILREVADWGEPSDSPLFKVAQELERYYKEKMK